MEFKPLFILGNPRSGTSLFRLMLTQHSKICIPPECGFIQWWWEKYKDWDINDASDTAKINEYVSDLKTSKKIETWNLDFDQLAESIGTQKSDSYKDLSLLVLNQYAIQQQKEPLYLGDKNNYYISHLELLDSIFPKAKYLLIIRDGRDVACSYKALKELKTESAYKPKLATGIVEIATEWVTNNERVLNYYSDKKDQLYVVKYENILVNTEHELTKVSSFLNLDYEIEMSEYYNQKKSGGRAVEPMLDWKRKVLEKPDEKNFNKYKKLLSGDEIRTFNEIARDMLVKYGYEI